MDWETHIELAPLLKEIFSRIKPYTIAKKMGKDKSVPARWKAGTTPTRPEDIGLLIACALEEGIDIAPFQKFAPLWDLSPDTSYEHKLQREAPDFSILASVPYIPSSRIKFGDMELDTPIGLASSPLTGDSRWTRAGLDLGYGLSTFKTRRAGKPVESWPSPQIAYVCGPIDLHDYDPANPPKVAVCLSRPNNVDSPVPDLVNSIGCPHEGEKAWPPEYEIVAQHPRGRFVGISVMGDALDAAGAADQFDRAVDVAISQRPPFIELNVSCPNLERETELAQDLQRVREICANAKKRGLGAGIPLFLKLQYMPEIALDKLLQMVAPHVDAIVLRNTLRVRPICKDRRENEYCPFPNREFGGLSGPSTFETTMRFLRNAVNIRSKKKYDFRIVAAGGVTTAAHVISLLNNGADLVQACTGAIFDPLLSWKVRYQYAKSRTKTESATSQDQFLQLPRTELEIRALHNLELAVEEYASRGFSIPFIDVRDTWHTWLQSQSAEVHGAARRASAPQSKDEWVRTLSRKAPRRNH
jgi:dihydroorotate dehydrogenase